jgi:hypothetical protein
MFDVANIITRQTISVSTLTNAYCSMHEIIPLHDGSVLSHVRVHFLACKTIVVPADHGQLKKGTSRQCVGTAVSCRSKPKGGTYLRHQFSTTILLPSNPEAAMDRPPNPVTLPSASYQFCCRPDTVLGPPSSLNRRPQFSKVMALVPCIISGLNLVAMSQIRQTR